MIIKTPAEIEIMAESGRRLAEVLARLAKETHAGITTRSLDRLAYQLIHESGAKPAFLNYRPSGAERAYPYSLCASVNGVVVHGQPSDYVIRDGDLVKLDLGVIYKKFYSDAAVTVVMGKVSREARRLVTATEEALAAGIAEAVLGNTLGDIGAAIAAVAKKNKCAIAEGLTGHGIGRDLHEDPAVFNAGWKGKGDNLQEGMVIAVEPMVNAGGPEVRMRDEWVAETADGSPSAHFEHTVAITANGPWILTRPKEVTGPSW